MVTLEVSSCEMGAVTIKSSTMSEENPYSPPVNQVEAPPIQSAVPGLHNYASLGERFSGKLIDVLIMIPLGLLGLVILVFSGGASVYGPGETFLVAIIGMAAYIGVQWAFWASTGQSIGKKVMKTQVVNLDGSQASVRTIAFKRYGIISLIGNVPVFGPLVYFIGVLLIFRQNRNCLHDDIAKTRVIKFGCTNAFGASREVF